MVASNVLAGGQTFEGKFIGHGDKNPYLTGSWLGTKLGFDTQQRKGKVIKRAFWVQRMIATKYFPPNASMNYRLRSCLIVHFFLYAYVLKNRIEREMPISNCWYCISDKSLSIFGKTSKLVIYWWCL